METRSRKRAEESTSASSSGPTTRANKRSRTSATSGNACPITKRSRTSAASETTSPIVTRSRAAAASQPATNMDSTPEPSSAGASMTRGRRGKTPGTNKNVGSNSNNKDNPNSNKGKQKELNIRPRETARNVGPNVDPHDDDGEGGAGVNLAPGSSAFHGLLRKLGAGLDDLLPSSPVGSGSSSHQSGRLKKILSGLRADGEEGKQIEALTQLCEMLSIGTEESLSTFSVESFVPVLVGLLNHENSADIMLLAVRAITHLVDVLPSSCAAVVHYGAVPCFVARLLTIEYMDLAEQSLQALKKISQEHPTACLRAGALMAVLSYIDFFSTGVQRVALSTAANMCKKLPSDASDFVMEAVPLLTNILQYQDAKLLEHASVCLTRITEAFSSSPERLDDLCNHGLVTQAATLISTSNAGGGQASLSTSTYTGLIRILSICASGSDLGAQSLLLLGISGILKGILSCSNSPSSMSVSPSLSRPPEQIFEIVNLANELLPPLPEGIISLPKEGPAGNPARKDDSNGNKNEESSREKLLVDQPEILQQFGVDLFPVLVQIYGSSVSGPVRHKCLSVISKLMYFSTGEVIQSLNNSTNISSFLAGVLAWKDPQVLMPALQIADILMEKLSGTFSKIFVREGVVHAVDALILCGTSQPSSSRKENDSIIGSSSRSRRNQRRGGTTSSDVNPDDDSNTQVPSNVLSTNLTETTNLSDLRATVSAYAKAFKDKYFPSCVDGLEPGLTDDLVRLKNLCMQLNLGSGEQKAKSKGKSKVSSSISADALVCKEERMVEVVSEIMRELNRDGGMSNFEFIGSGVVSSLLSYFTCGCFSKEKVSEGSLTKLRQQAIGRYKSFLSISLPLNLKEESEIPMNVLVKKLQDALSSLERFPVVLSHTSSSSGGSGTARLSSGLSVLSQPIKLRLFRAQGEKTLRDYSSNIVLIDPLATLGAVEDFLWPRVQRNDPAKKPSASPGNSGSVTTTAAAGTLSQSPATPATGARHHSTRSRSSTDSTETAKKELSLGKNSSLSKAKGKAVLKQTQEEGSGPQTRNAARRRAALYKDNETKAVNGDLNSEEDEFDMSQAEMDDNLVIEEDISDDMDDEDDDDEIDDEDVMGDDTLPLWMSSEVHDVKLGESTEDIAAPAANDDQKAPARSSVRGSDSMDLRSRTSFGSRGAMSFAAAAMTGLSSGNARGVRGLRDRQGRSLTGSSDPPRLVFTAGGRQLSKHFTIYQAIQRQFGMDENDDNRLAGIDHLPSDGSRLLSDIYAITYEKADGQAERFGVSSSTPPSRSAKASSRGSSSSDGSSRHLSLLDSIVRGQLPCDLERTNPTYNCLALLRILEGLNQLGPWLRAEAVIDRFSEGKISSLDELTDASVKLPPDDFISSKLTPKLARQIQDVLALCSGSLPSWCYQLTKACPFLFPFETRRQYFYTTAFGLARALNRLQQQQGADGNSSTNERRVRVGRIERQKVRVSRNRILDSAAKVMEMYCNQKTVLEVEYFGEVGTGLGPTLEFYTLLSHDLQKAGLGLWRSDSSVGKPSMEVDRSQGTAGLTFSGGDKDVVHAPLGLFPRPWPPSADSSNGSQFSKVIEYFRLLGRVMAKALQDGRLLDLPLSAAFYKLLLRQDLDLHDIIFFDSELGTTLRELHALVRRKQYLESKGNYNEEELRFRGASIEDLCLDFSVPGYPEYKLKPGDVNVDMSNLEEYVSLVVDATVGSGIMRQVEAFSSGFNQVFDISMLQIFSPNELDYLICGRRELWTAESLAAHIKFDHGYTSKSPPIVNLLEIMCEFSPDQQRAFCQFVTGAPRLPPGGLAVLNPKLTIVRKHSSSTSNTANNGSGGPSESADDDLPSVMTCANYLKLPPYSSKEIMYKKLLYAISEGQGSFDLS